MTREAVLDRNTTQNLTRSTPLCTFPTRAASIGNRSAIRGTIYPIIAGFFRGCVATNISAPAEDVIIWVWLRGNKSKGQNLATREAVLD